MVHSSPGQELRAWHLEARAEALFAETLLPHLCRMELSDTHGLESPPDRKPRCFPCRSAVRWGQWYPSVSWERLWGGRAVSHPRLCIGLCQLGLCVAVTQIAVGEPGSGDAVHRFMLIIRWVRGEGLPVAGWAAGRERQGQGQRTLILWATELCSSTPRPKCSRVKRSTEFAVGKHFRLS